MNKKTNLMNIGVLPDRESAESAICELESEGYDSKEISFLAQDIESAKTINQETGVTMVEGETYDINPEGTSGAFAGILAGLGSILPTSVNSGLSGAVTGALEGELESSLEGVGVSKEIARIYEDKIKSGGVLLVVASSGQKKKDPKSIMEKYGADQVRSIIMKE